MSKTKDAAEAARKLCPRQCADCCCEVHHWSDYGPDVDDATGLPDPDDDTLLSCKHCPAALAAREVCTRCEAELIEHDEFDCPDGGGQFRYEGEPKRVCDKGPHPWDEDDEDES